MRGFSWRSCKGEAVWLKSKRSPPGNCRTPSQRRIDESLRFARGAVNLQRLFHLYEETPRPDLKYPPFIPKQVQIVGDVDSMFAAIRRWDTLLHHPTFLRWSCPFSADGGA
jgi:polyphosphate kinase